MSSRNGRSLGYGIAAGMLCFLLITACSGTSDEVAASKQTVPSLSLPDMNQEYPARVDEDGVQAASLEDAHVPPGQSGGWYLVSEGDRTKSYVKQGPGNMRYVRFEIDTRPAEAEKEEAK